MYVGDSSNPLPSLVFSSRDAEHLGYFLFGECRTLDREFENLTCPINGFEDSWGIIVVTANEVLDPFTANEIEGLARRVGLSVYSNNFHGSNID
jgi:hypothetical protein